MEGGLCLEQLWPVGSLAGCCCQFLEARGLDTYILLPLLQVSALIFPFLGCPSPQHVQPNQAACTERAVPLLIARVLSFHIWLWTSLLPTRPGVPGLQPGVGVSPSPAKGCE